MLRALSPPGGVSETCAYARCMGAPAEWIEHRRGGRDRERLGWIRPALDDEGDGFVAIDLLGREITGAVEWLHAEDALESAGLGYLAEPYELLTEDQWMPVRLVEVSPEIIRVKREDWGAIDLPTIEYTVPFPMPDVLRALTHRSSDGGRAQPRL